MKKNSHVLLFENETEKAGFVKNEEKALKLSHSLSFSLSLWSVFSVQLQRL